MKLSYEPLTPQQLEAISDSTMELLENYGIILDAPWAVELLKANGASAEGKYVKIPRELIKKALESVPREFLFRARNPKYDIHVKQGANPVLIPGCGGIYIRDENGDRRASKKEDFINLLKLAHTSDVCNVACSTVTYPEGYDTKVLFPWQIAKTLVMSDKPLYMHSSDKTIAECGIAMARKAVGDDEAYVAMGNVNSLSPMRWDVTMLDTLKAFSENRQPLVIGCCSLMGVTSHLFLEDTLISNNAEVLTGLTLTQLISPGTPVIYAGTSGAANMSNMSLSLGAPETVMYSAALAQLGKYYNIPFRTGGALTDSKVMDMQAGIESAFMLLSTLSGGSAVVLHSLGSMECFNSVDYLKWIMDEEIIGRIRWMLQPVPDLESDAADVIGENGTECYLEHDDTLDNFRERVFMPKISDCNNYETWSSMKLDNESKARKVYNSRIEKYSLPEGSERLEEEFAEYLSLI